MTTMERQAIGQGPPVREGGGRTVITRLWGGLGNQLFQYAAGYAAASAAGAELLLDPTQCFLDRNRPYALDAFQISGRIWTESERKRIERRVRLARPVSLQTRITARVIKQMMKPMLNRNFAYIEDKHQGYQENVFARANEVYLAGTWANEGYFKRHCAELRRELSLRNPPCSKNAELSQRMNGSESICVHVRRGDYIKNPDTAQRFGVCSLEYYQQALGRLSLHLNTPVLYVFSDDVGWCEENLRFDCKVEYVRHNQGKDHHLDLWLMSCCRHFIIANSTFSWWGAWLGEAPDKVVVAPRRWSLDSTTIADPVPSRWLRA